jgi:hypothetical protein
MLLIGKILSGMLLICIPVQVFGWDWHTKITVSIDDQPLQSVCELLEQQYGIHFSYSRDIVNISRKVTLNVRDKPLKDLLDDLFSPYDIHFARIGEQIVLTAIKDPQRTVSGYVQDQRTGERLIGATVYSPVKQVGTITNQFGFFSLTIPKDTCSLQVTYIGYTPVRLPVAEISAKQVIVVLQSLTSLHEVVITETTGERQPGLMQMSKISLSPTEVKSMPRLLGESDMMRAIASLPGVSGGMDGGGSLNVRGGSPDQNLILLDGTPVFNSSHLLGIFSVFNPDIVKRAEFYKGAFPARYGGRVSSIVDISTKDGDMQEYHGEASVGLIAAKFMAEGPIVKNKTSFLVSARRSYTDLVIDNLDFTNEDNQRSNVDLYFYDINLKINHIFSPVNRIYLSGYLGDDHFNLTQNVHTEGTANYSSSTEKSNTGVGWGNMMGTLRWNHVFNPRLFANATLNYSRYSFTTNYNYDYITDSVVNAIQQYGEYYSRIRDGVFKLDFEYRPNPLHTIKFGSCMITHVFNPGVSLLNNNYQGQAPVDTSYEQTASKGKEMSLYAEDEWDVNKSLHINAGIYLSGFVIDKIWYNSVQPRLGMRYQLPHYWTLKMSYTHMNQYLHLLTNSEASLPTDIWVPSSSKVKPIFSKQVSMAICKASKDNMFAASVEVYYKTMDNMTEYRDESAFFNASGNKWDEEVVVGTGRSYGGELFLEKKRGKTKGWIGYTLAWSDRKFPGINNGKSFPYKYDRRHDVEVIFTQQLSKRWEISASWEYSSGLPITLPVASYEGIGDSSPWDAPPNTPILDHVSNRNQFRGKSQHRLDLSATHTKQKKRFERSWTFSLFNAYNQSNPFLYGVFTDRTKQERYLEEITILPILPSITYSIKF